MAIQMTFQLDNASERALVAKCIHALEESTNGSIEKCSVTEISQHQEIKSDKSEIESLSKDNKNLKESVKRYRKQSEKDQTLINKLQEEISALRSENELKIKEAEDALKIAEENEGKINKTNEEWKGKVDDLINNHNEQLRQLNENHSTEVVQLNRRIEILKKQLEAYVPNISSSGNGEKHYFKVDGEYLTETLSTEAPYIGVDSGEIFQFQFNYENGPVGEACNNKNVLLLPFCEITDDVEGASGIVPDGWGLAIMSGGVLKVKEKAKIKLVRR